jgi:hypothetical protein
VLTQQFPQFRENVAGCCRFGNKYIAPYLLGALAIFRKSARRERDDRQPRVALGVPEPADEIPPAQPRQAKIQQNNVEIHLGETFPTRLAIGALDDVEPERAEVLRKPFPSVTIVVNDQAAWHVRSVLQ